MCIDAELTAALQNAQASSWARMCAVCHRSLGSALPKPGRPGLRHPVLRTRAVAEEDKTGIDADKIGVLKYTPDTESWTDVMAFKGPAPEVSWSQSMVTHSLHACAVPVPAEHLFLSKVHFSTGGPG